MWRHVIKEEGAYSKLRLHNLKEKKKKKITEKDK